MITERFAAVRSTAGRSWPALLLLPALAAFAAACAPSKFDAVAWDPPAWRGFDGPFAAVTDLSPLQLIPTLDGHGPETVIAGPDGWMFTGLKDGRILRFRPDGSAVEVFADTKGRANGLAFAKDGRLIAADSYRGLIAIDPSGAVEVLATEAGGVPFTFPDGLDIAADGTIWFTDATTRFPDGLFHYDILESRPTGRLLSYDPVSRSARVRASGLRFPNGIALGPRDEYVLINETLGYRTLRHWIAGPSAGATETFVEGYPGLPDDIRFDGDGLFWVALVGERIPIVDWIQPHPWLKTIVAHAIGWAVPDTDHPILLDPAIAVAVDTEGNVVQTWRDESGQFLGSTSVLEHEGRLFIGSIGMGGVGVSDLPEEGPDGSRH